MKSARWKERFFAQLRSGKGVNDACAAAGVNKSTVYRHQSRHPKFARDFADAKATGRAVEANLQLQNIRGGVEQIKSKCAQRFASVMCLIPETPSVAEACAQAGVKVADFYVSMKSKPLRRQAYDELIATLDSSSRGRRRKRHTFNDEAFKSFVRVYASGVSMAEAGRVVGLPRQIILRRRKVDPEFNAQVRSIATEQAQVRRSRLNDAGQREAALSALESGIPLVVLGHLGLPCQEAIRQHALRNPNFKEARDKAVRVGRIRRCGDATVRYEKVLDMVGAGCAVSRLHLHGLPWPADIYRRCREDPEYDRRLQAARRRAQGNALDDVELSDEKILNLVSKRLPGYLSADERSSCMAQAWLDLQTGELRAQNLAQKIRGYVMECKPLGTARTIVDISGDLISGYD